MQRGTVVAGGTACLLCATKGGMSAWLSGWVSAISADYSEFLGLFLSQKAVNFAL